MGETGNRLRWGNPVAQVAAGSRGGLQTRKAGHGTGAWNRVSNLVAGLPSSGKGPQRAICDLASAGRGQVHRQCVLESWTGGCRNKHPARFLLLISCLFAQVGRLCLNTLRGKGSQSQPNGVTGYPRWTRIHDHWQKASSQTLWMTVCMSQIGALSLVAKGVEIGCCFVCICKCWFKN